MTTRNQLIEFAALMGRETAATPSTIVRLLRLAGMHQRIATVHCERDLTPKEQSKYERIEREICALAMEIGGTGAILNGDPRGCTVKLTVKSGRTNDWGGEGICVPA